VERNRDARLKVYEAASLWSSCFGVEADVLGVGCFRGGLRGGPKAGGHEKEENMGCKSVKRRTGGTAFERTGGT